MWAKRFICLRTEYLHIEVLLYRERAQVILDYDNIMQDLVAIAIVLKFSLFKNEKVLDDPRNYGKIRKHLKLIRQSLKLEKNWRTYGLGDFTLNIRTGAMIEMID